MSPPPPTTLYLIRHGQSQANVGGITLPNPIVPLTDLGELQARSLATLLPPTSVKIWASPFKRALDTAAPYCARIGAPAVTRDDLREFETVDTAQLSGSPASEREAVVTRYWIESDPERRTGPAAETFHEFYSRVARARTQFLPSLPDGTMIFGHGMWMAMLFWQIWGFEGIDHAGMSLFRRFQLGFPTPNTATYRLIRTATGGWEVKADEAAMRAIASIGRGIDQPSHQEEPLDIGEDAEHNVEIEPAHKENLR